MWNFVDEEFNLFKLRLFFLQFRLKSRTYTGILRSQIGTMCVTVSMANQQKIDKSGGKRRNTLGCLDQYTCNVLRLWNSRDRETV